jgi:hypothetical protein
MLKFSCRMSPEIARGSVEQLARSGAVAARSQAVDVVVGYIPRRMGANQFVGALGRRSDQWVQGTREARHGFLVCLGLLHHKVSLASLPGLPEVRRL